MLAQTIISLTVIVVLTVAMAFLLAKIVKQMNTESKEYFEKKIVVYDELINEKEKQLSVIKSELADDKLAKSQRSAGSGNDKGLSGLVIMNEDLPKYKIEGSLKIAKKIDDKFKLDKAQAIKKFISERVEEGGDHTQRASLEEAYDKLCGDDGYSSITKSLDDGWEFANSVMDGNARDIMKPYMIGSPRADINEILGYIKLELDKKSPEITVETGDKDDDFGYISDTIKTIYNPEIYTGFRIFYHDRMYDYSLRGIS